MVSTSTIPKFHVQKPLNREQAAKVWRETLTYGEFTDADPALDSRDALLAQGTMGFGLVWIAAGAIAGQVIGATKGVSPERLREASDVIKQVIAGLSLQELVRTSVVRRAAGRCPHPVRLVTKPFPPGQEAEYSQMAGVMCATLAWLPSGQNATQYLTAQGVDTVLEIQLLRPGLVGKGGINPSLHVAMEGRVRLVSVRDSEELASAPIRYRGAGRKFTDWAASNAHMLRTEIASGCDQLAEQCVRQIFSRELSDLSNFATCRRHTLANR